MAQCSALHRRFRQCLVLYVEHCQLFIIYVWNDWNQQFAGGDSKAWGRGFKCYLGYWQWTSLKNRACNKIILKRKSSSGQMSLRRYLSFFAISPNIWDECWAFWENPQKSKLERHVCEKEREKEDEKGDLRESDWTWERRERARKDGKGTSSWKAEIEDTKT